MNFRLRETLVLRFNKAACCHFDPIASWSFEPPLTYLDIVISNLVMPEIITTWTIGVMSLPDLQACGFTIQRGHPLDTIERRRAAIEEFADRQWKYCSFGAPELHQYLDPPPPPSLPPTISDVIVAPFFISLVVSYIVADDVEIRSVYVELLDSNYTLIELKQAGHIPLGAVSYSALFEFINLSPGRSYIVKLYGVDTNDNITSWEEYTQMPWLLLHRNPLLLRLR